VSAFASLLREFRIASGLTQEALTERCRMSRAMIAALERGRREAPRPPAVALIAGSVGGRWSAGRGWRRLRGAQAHPPGFLSAWVVR
jgi:transcriptional regulator with XRE-family HTH domain